MRVVFGAAVAALALAGAADAREMGGSSFKVGAWSGAAYTGSAGSGAETRFSHCASSAGYVNGASLLFMITREYQWAVGFMSENFSLRQNEPFKVGLSIDGSAPVLVEGYVISPTFFRVNLIPKSTLFERFQRASMLTLLGKDRKYNFSLRDTSRMLPVLLSCVKRQLEPIQMQATAPSARPEPVRGGGQDYRAEVTSLAANLLSEAGVKGFRLNSTDDAKGTVTWTAPGGNGALLVMTDQNVKRPSDMTPKLISIAAEKCKGKFMSGAMPEENGAARSFSSCQIGTGEPATGYYLTIPRSAGGHYVIMTWPAAAPAGGSGSVDEADRDIRNAAYRVLR